MQYECNSENQAESAPREEEQPVEETTSAAPEQEISKSEALRLVRERWPEAFRVSSPRPLKIGVHNDMKQSGDLPLPVIKSALKFFTSQDRYLLAIKPDRNRIDLNGKPCGKVKLKEAVNAEITLFQRHEKRQQKNRRVHVGQLKLVSREPMKATETEETQD